VYDSQVNADGVLYRITDDVIFLWLNDAHYDLILSPKTFLRFNLSHFCFKCMRYYKHFENYQTHVCKTEFSCKNCYSNNNMCAKEENFKIECSECHVLFYNRDCFQKHLTNRVFQHFYKQGTYVTPCIYYLFCLTCYKQVTSMKKISTRKAVKHKCDQYYCVHCNSIMDRSHACYMKLCKIPKTPTLPTLYFYDFETCVDDEGYMQPFYCVVQKVCSACDEKAFEKSEEGFVAHATNNCCDISVKSVPCCG
jgi:hypothetical protein